MAGHSKWAQVKHKKEKVDKERGKIFNKLIREITVAARLGGGDIEFNPRLRLAVERAKSYNMPWENIERAIKKGTGELEGVKYEEVIYEGYGPGGVAIIVEATTDNKNRTTNEIRHIFSKYGGNLGTTGCVSWQFKDKGILNVPKGNIDEEELFEIAIEAGAEDIKTEGEYYEITCSPQNFYNLKKILTEKGIEVQGDIMKIPNTTVKIEGKKAEALLKLLQTLEEHDDVQRTYSNFEIEEKEFEALTKTI